MAMNGKFCGGGIQIVPYACINDGMADITWISDPAINCLTGVADAMDKAKAGGVHVYDHWSMFMRGKKIVTKFKGKLNKPQQEVKGPQLLHVDGEPLTFDTKVTWEAMKQHLEVCFDTDRYFKEYEWFKPKLPISKL